jgi:phospholipid/cholesterol/gamma-HCH transport system ATP-binding protein
VIEYLDVHKAFDAPVLAGVTLAVRDGETLSILGPSGTGKSVLLKTTIGLITPDRGDVRVDGRSVTAASPGELAEIRRAAGYVFQNAALFDSMTVYENVRFGLPDRELKAAASRDILSRVCRALEDVNLDPRQVLRKLPSELSGGMRKRVGLARALVGRPRILLYDEPVTGLDPVNAAAVERLITEVAAKFGVTSVVVTHDVEGALAVSDRVALLHGGRLRFLGTPEEFRLSRDGLVRAFAERETAAEAARLLEDR